MVIHSLSDIPIQKIADVFNTSFNDYFVPISMDEASLSAKIKSENIFLDYSVGVTADDQLVAFILTGIDSIHNRFFSYNAGTGVIPEFRGQKLPQKMYDYLLPLLNKNNIHKHQLEVITENTKALKVYQNIGYQINKQVSCFKGKINLPANPATFTTRRIELQDETIVHPFWNHFPTYQNTLSSINRNKEMHESLGVFHGGYFVGYIVYAKSSGRIKQFGVHQDFRKKGIGHHLFCEVQKANPTLDVSLINIDNNDSGTIAFLQKIGLEITIGQFEMVLLV